MTRSLSILFISFLTLISCNKDDNTTLANITINFSHSWDDNPVTINDFNAIKFTNEKGDKLSIERLRYLISNISFHKQDGSITGIDNYNLVDLTNNASLSFTPSSQVPTGSYTNVTFTFGFNNNDNIDGAYLDLNSTSWNVPNMLGGGYHYMQFDGKFINNINEQQGFNYHAIRAVNNAGADPIFPQDTFFTVSLGPVNITNTTIFNVEMNIAEWFKNPNIWNLNNLNQMLMPNATAQIMMFENGQNVFSLKSIE